VDRREDFGAKPVMAWGRFLHQRDMRARTVSREAPGHFRVPREECDVTSLSGIVDACASEMAMGPRALPAMQSQSLRYISLLHGRLSQLSCL
jgi:hypothetical protein